MPKQVSLSRSTIKHCLLLALLFVSTSLFAQNKNIVDAADMKQQPFIQTNFKVITDSCALCSLPPIKFNNHSIKLSRHAKVLLDSVVGKLTMHPGCNVKVTGYEIVNCFPRRKVKKLFMFERVTGIMTYFVGKGINEGRLIFAIEPYIPEKQNIIDLHFTADTSALISKPPSPRAAILIANRRAD